jgi:hypothetical protein
MTADLKRAKDPLLTGWDDAWVGLEPTFQSKKSLELYAKHAGDEDKYFEHPYMVGTVRKIGRRMAKKYGSKQHHGADWCLFDPPTLSVERDPWDVTRSELEFAFTKAGRQALQVNFGMDPFTFEFGIKPVPLPWLYDERFVLFLQKLVFDVPLKHGLSASILNGGGQFHLSAKQYLTGSLLADDLATRLNHPELATWVMDWPNCDDRSMRSTVRRFEAYRDAIGDYWRGAYHPEAVGVLTAENALFDVGFEPAPSVPEQPLMTDSGPTGPARDVFQTNFALGRSLRWRAQNVHPGYWQTAHPDVDGYQPHQIMRNSEVNLNRLQIAGELHVKNAEVLNAERVPELDAPLDASMLMEEASYEQRAHISRTSARDYVDAILLDVHHARWLQTHPHVKILGSLAQDQLSLDAELTVKKHAGAGALERLRKVARASNLEQSDGRLRTDFIEPETLFFAAWRALPAGGRAEIAREAVGGFVERVHQAASVDPRGANGDPMDAHRHRIHPLLWEALQKSRPAAGDAVGAELKRFLEDPDACLSKRPVFSQVGEAPPWDDVKG